MPNAELTVLLLPAAKPPRKLCGPVKGDYHAWQYSWCASQPAVLTANMGGASLNGERNPDDEYAALSLSPSLTTSSFRVCVRAGRAWDSVGTATVRELAIKAAVPISAGRISCCPQTFERLILS